MKTVTVSRGVALVSRYELELASDGHRPSTVHNYVAIIERWRRSGLDPVQYLARLNVTPGTRVLRGRVLKQYLNWAVAKGNGRNPLADMHFHNPPRNGERPFSGREIERLFAACRTPFQHAVILLLLTLGLRASELSAVREGAIEEGTLRVCGKGGKSRLLGTTATIEEALLTVARRRPGYQIIYRTVREVGRTAGLENCHPHRLRHTFADAWLRTGGDLGSLRVLMGHSRLDQTLYYASFYEGERALEQHRRFLQAG